MSADTLGDYSALQLFVERARQVQHNFASTPSDIAAILRIGQITEGMPLALELAAAALRSHPCAAVASALENGQQVLATQMRDLPERQRSMQAVFAHSMRLLSANEHQAFCALSVFHGGFTAEAAAEVAGAPQQMLAAFVDKSLLRMGKSYRYDMHELMRQFAKRELEISSLSTDVRERYNLYFVILAKAAEGELIGAQQGIWIAQLEQEIDNIRAVLQWLQHATPEMALHMAFNLYWFWHSRSYHQEGLDWFSRLSTSDAPASQAFQANVYGAASWFALCLNRVEEAMAWVTKSLALYKTLDVTDRQTTKGYIFALTRLGFVLLCQAEYERALAVCRTARQFAQALDDKYLTSVTWYCAGEVYAMQEMYDQSQESYEKSLRLVREINNVRAIGQRSARLANILTTQGDLEQARLLCRQALDIYNECQDHVGLTMALLVVVRLANLDGDFQRAALLLGATDRILDTTHIVRTWPQDRRSYEASDAILRQHLEASIFEQQVAKGRALSLEQTVTLALSGQE
jgi:tetratricopeptide (TPR) repeat protein